MSPFFKIVGFLAVGLILAAQTAGAAPVVTRTYQINPNYRTELVFPSRIKQVTGTVIQGGLRFRPRGNILSVRPVRWPKGDRRYSYKTVINVFTAGAAYQLNIAYDFGSTEQLIEVQAPKKLVDGKADFRDQLFARFIRNRGHLQSTPIRYPALSKKGGSVKVLRVYRVHDALFVVGILDGPINTNNLDELNIMPSLQGQIFFEQHPENPEQTLVYFHYEK